MCPDGLQSSRNSGVVLGIVPRCHGSADVVALPEHLLRHSSLNRGIQLQRKFSSQTSLVCQLLEELEREPALAYVESTSGFQLKVDQVDGPGSLLCSPLLSSRVFEA